MYHTASEEEAKQVMSASRFQSAEIVDCTSHKTFALPKLIYKDGDNLLSLVQDAVVDSGSTMTITGTPINCRDCKPVKVQIQLAKKGETMTASYICKKTYYVRNRSGELQKIELSAYIVSDIRTDIIGCKILTDQGFRIILDRDPKISGVYPRGENGEYDISESFAFQPREDLYVLEVFQSRDAFTMEKGYGLWHERLSHTEQKAIKKSIEFTIGLEGLKDQQPTDLPCLDCMIGKAQRNARPGPLSRRFPPMGQVHWDLVSATEPSIEGYIYALILIDKATRYRWVYGLRAKNEVFALLRRWWADTSAIRQNHPLLSLMRDNAGENKTSEIDAYFEDKGVAARYSTPLEQWQDAPPEASIRVLGRLVRSELSGSGLPTKAWFSSMVNGAESCNATWIEATKSTPYFDLTGEKRNVSKFRRFGCEAVIYLEPPRRPVQGKYQPRAIAGVNLGFATDRNTSAYKIWVVEENKIYITNQVRFNEHKMPMKQEPLRVMGQGTITEKVFVEDSEVVFVHYDPRMVIDSLLEDNIITKKGDEIVYKVKGANSTYVKVNVNQYRRDMIKKQSKGLNLDWTPTEPPMNVVYQVAGPQAGSRGAPGLKPALVTDHRIKGLPISIDPTKPPRNYAEAMRRPDAEEWDQAFREEYLGFKERNAFKIVYPQKGDTVIGTTTRIEYKIEKVRMCARGDQQQPYEHYNPDDLYAATLKPTEVRLLTAMAAEKGYTIYKTDTKQAFLYGDMGSDRILIRPPDWWPESLKPGQVLQAVRSVYGTKQAPRCWHTRVSTWMEENGYLPANDEKTIFRKEEANGDSIVHGLFVDDMMHIPSTKRMMKEFLDLYNKEFQTTGGMTKAMDMFVGIEYQQSSSGINLHQDHYMQVLIEDYQKQVEETLYSRKIPMSLTHELCEDEEPVPSLALQKLYRSFNQRLNYAAVWTRPDIAHTVGQLARFGGRAGPSHMAALHYLMGYLKARPSFKLRYVRGTPGEDPLSGYVDSDWRAPKSVTGYLALYNLTPIAWRSKRQPTTALSTAEAEYMAASVGAKELIYLRRLCAGLGNEMRGPTPVGEDNTACIEWANYVIGGRERAKHIDLRKHFAHAAVQNGEIVLYKVASCDQLADILTKALSQPLMERCISGILHNSDSRSGRLEAVNLCWIPDSPSCAGQAGPMTTRLASKLKALEAQAGKVTTRLAARVCRAKLGA